MVVLIDRCEPGSETSYGNAGIISSGSISPLNNPSLWKALPKYLTNRHAALRWNPVWAGSERRMGRALSGRLSIVAFQAASDRAAWVDRRIGEIAAGMDRESGSGASHSRDRLAEGVARRCGEVAKQEQALLAEYGIASELLDRQAVSALEPGIVPVYKVGLLHTETASVDLPGAVVKAYARMFARAGGDVRQADVKAIVPDGDRWRVVLADGEISARHVVVALGPWSAEILRPLGYRVPLAFERGYHREFKPNPARPLRRPIYDIDGGFIMTPMEQGIRVTSGVELTGRDAPSSFAQLDQVVPLARGVANSATRSAKSGEARGRRCPTACR